MIVEMMGVGVGSGVYISSIMTGLTVSTITDSLIIIPSSVVGSDSCAPEISIQPAIRTKREIIIIRDEVVHFFIL